jgi:DNA-binding FadR family transcriptional regulator
MPFLHRSTVAAETARQIREMIRAQKLQPGQILPPQRELAAQFGVGFSTIREALQMLVSTGLIESCSGRGTWVSDDALNVLLRSEAAETRLGDLDLLELHEARSLIEVRIAELATQRAMAEDTERLLTALENMRANLGNDEGFARTDLEFHLAVARAAHNGLFEQFYHLITTLMSEFIHKEMIVPEGRLGKRRESVLARNTALVEAIRARDARQARAIARDILKDVDELLDVYRLQQNQQSNPSPEVG